MGREGFNPCLDCGACCAMYRASFYWAEADDVSENGVPVEMTRQLTPFRRCMLTTEPGGDRCVALLGVIGRRVSCSIYERRSSVCRDFPASWVNGVCNDRCDRARATINLPPILPHEWDSPGNYPKAA
ncbi:MAG: YkgJ family cysteine cluster protein [Proteobacteria bacterium]|nr:YkgJ family cysteine cluster protein [Pseudomonadota bacterium]MBU1736600.1 YkgJ family cysteine cluster protein [Pseudomonadota bacterium]